MLIVLVPIFFFLFWLILFERDKEKSLRRTFLKTYLFVFLFCTVITEILSLFRFLDSFSIAFLWLAADLAFLLYLRNKVKSVGQNFFRDFGKKLSSAPKFFIFSAGFVYLTVLFIALASPPNTYDSLTYHLSRVAHWIQNGTVEFYPTAILRQLYQPPLAEYAILHLHLLSGNDMCANLVQWASLVGCGAAVSLILAEFGGSLRTQFFGILLTATLPGAIVQGSSTQNDLVASLFISSFFYFWLRAVRLNSWKPFIWTGVALGLAVFTKSTAYLYCFPVGLFFSVVHFLTLKNTDEKKRFVGQVALVLSIALMINAGHYARNFALFGAPVTTGDDEVRNENVNVKIILANLARNYAVNLGSKSDTLKNAIESGMKRIFGDELKNPDSTWLDNEFAVNFSTHEDLAGNFVHILLITIALFLIFRIRAEEKKYVYGVVFTIVSGFLLFSALLKWQIWSARLQLPLFVLGCILVAFVVGKIRLRTEMPLAVLCLAVAWLFIFYAEPRRILGENNELVLTSQSRRQKFFRNLPDAEILFVEAVEVIRRQSPVPTEIGLHIEYNDFEYPVWFLLKSDFRAAPKIYHVGVSNVSSRLAVNHHLPELIFSTKEGNIIENTAYIEIWKKDVFRVLKKTSFEKH
jgi:hypothetical protein